MTLTKQKKLADQILYLLKLQEIQIPIGRTNKGNLAIRFDGNTDDFEIVLDSIPLSTKNMLVDENNIELKRILTKYLFDPEPEASINEIKPIPIEPVIQLPPSSKKRGRPVGSKNANSKAKTSS